MEIDQAKSDASAPSRTATVRSLWTPIGVPTFRHLLIADVVSDIGAFMQSVGAAWLMVSLGAGPALVALTQTASTLPFFLLALPAGAIGDIVDRRRLILLTETWMMAAAAALAIATLAGIITPWLLLALTFAISAGDAFETPSWRAVLPELVQKEDLAAASALNGIEFNIARAVGPALAGLVIAAAGVGAAFVLNVVSFVGVIVVVAQWRRPVRSHTAPSESIGGAIIAAVRYVRNAPDMLGLMLRSGVVMVFASAVFALLPTVARAVNDSAVGYGILLGCFGAGAVGGALVMQQATARWSAETVASAAVVLLGASIVATSRLHVLSALSAMMMFAGAGWIVFVSLVGATVQNLAPEWIRARLVAVFMLISQGGMAAGSALWGALASRASVETALLVAGIGTMATIALGRARLPDTVADVSPWVHDRMRMAIAGVVARLEDGPVLVTVEYRVTEQNVAPFLKAMRAYRRVRRRTGASRWGVFHDLRDANLYVETFLVSSWAEHLRQHERSVQADRDVVEEVRRYTEGPPMVRHLVLVS
jgi:MFS family permease